MREENKGASEEELVKFIIYINIYLLIDLFIYLVCLIFIYIIIYIYIW